ncbi:UNVERIFIED_CONTAM: hypothetical protein GTU68_058387 [Idotea baltica]|nr:hypothetical protein [Idotea baltica]
MLAVAFGAFGAHALKSRLDEYALGVFETAVRYQLYHTLALLAVGVIALTQVDSTLLRSSGWLFLVGTIVFSGSLYILSLSGVRWWGAVTPLGGLALIAGWGCLAAAAWTTLS